VSVIRDPAPVDPRLSRLSLLRTRTAARAETLICSSRDELVDALDVSVDVVAIVTPNRRRERRIADLLRRRVSDIVHAGERNRRRRLSVAGTLRRRLVASHAAALTCRTSAAR
jgi:hypothetical protein